MANDASNDSIRCIDLEQVGSEFDTDGYDMSAVADLSAIVPVITGDDGLHLPTGTLDDTWCKDPEKATGCFLYTVVNRFLYYYYLNTSKSKANEKNDDYIEYAARWLKPYKVVEEKCGNIVLLSYTDGNDSTPKEKRIRDLMQDLLAAYDQLYDEFMTAHSERTQYLSTKTVRKCVTEYYRLVSKSVFFPENNNLLNVYFRNSEYLKQLVLPGYDKHPIDPAHLELGYIVPFADAFSLSALLETADYLANLAKTMSKTNPKLHSLRLAQARTLSDMSFGRYIYLNGESYRVTMNRQTSLIVARPFYRRSSVTAVKPVRLFEKIKTFLCGFYEQCKNNSDEKTIECRISVIGHSEMSHLTQAGVFGGRDGNGEEVEILDLCMALDGWIREQRKRKLETDKELTVQFDYYVNYADWYTCAGKQRFDDTSDKSKGKTIIVSEDSPVYCHLIPKDFESHFAYSTEEMTNIVGKSNMTFLLEPSFLFYEDYESSQKAPLSYYCRKMTDCVENGSAITWKIKPQAHDEGVSSMEYLSSQMNRIMASQSMTVGNVFRVINDEYVNKIREAAEKTSDGKKRTVFLFSSETKGLNMGSLAFYPLSRVEKYNDKKMTIIQFCNYPLPCVMGRWKSEKLTGKLIPSARYDISLWSFLKYQSIMYAFEYKDVWTGNFSPADKSIWTPYDYLRILKSVIVRLEITPNTSKQFGVNVTLGIKDCLDHYLEDKLKEHPDSGLTVLSIKKALLDHYKGYVQMLAEQVLFQSDPADPSRSLMQTGFSIPADPSRSLMQTGFSMNMFSAAEGIRDMFFLYLYDRERKKGTLDRLVSQNEIRFTTLSEKDSIVPRNNNASCRCYDEQFFMDKKMFLEIPEHLGSSGSLDLVGRALCDRASKFRWIVPGTDQTEQFDYYEDLPRALLKMCDWAGIGSDPLYSKIKAWAAMI